MNFARRSWSIRGNRIGLTSYLLDTVSRESSLCKPNFHAGPDRGHEFVVGFRTEFEPMERVHIDSGVVIGDGHKIGLDVVGGFY